jgi:hypothetical protein
LSAAGMIYGRDFVIILIPYKCAIFLLKDRKSEKKNKKKKQENVESKGDFVVDY